MELVKLVAVLMRRKWLLIQAVAFFVVAAGVLALNLPKQFQSTSQLIVRSLEADASVLSDLGLNELARGLTGESEEIQNHIAMLTARPILDQVIWKLQLRNDSGVLLPPDKLLVPGIDAAFTAPPNVSVKQHQSTDLILVTAKSGDPDLSRMLADTLAQSYIEETLARSRRESSEARAFVEGRLEVVAKEFERAMTEMADVQQREQVVDLQAEVKSAVSRMSDLMLSGELTAVRVQELRAQISEVKRVQSQESVGFLAPKTVTENLDIRGLRDTLVSLRQERETLLLEKTAIHPDVKRVDAQIQGAQGEIAVALDQQHALQPDLVRLQTELSGLVEKAAEINAAIDRTTERFAQYPEKMRLLSQLQLEASAAEQVYRSLQDQTFQIAIAEAMTVSPLHFVERARLPERHLFPKLLPCLIYGLLLGLLAGLSLVVVFEYIDDSVQTAEELQALVEWPLFGVVPVARQIDVGLAETSPTHPVPEAFRVLRASMADASPDQPAHLLAVTSALPGEGKSTTTAHLALSLAREGRRVLVLDCDLRAPRQQDLWQVASNGGLTAVLDGTSALSDVVQESGVEGLSVVVAGDPPPDPGRLVESLKLRQLLLEAAKGWDAVVVDTPSILLVDDARVICRVVDQVLVVVQAHATPRTAFLEAASRLGSAGVKSVGSVLNRGRPSAGAQGRFKKVLRLEPGRDIGEGVA
jgi:succinoglycan biosynthesis transport protein ExoP